MAFEIGNKLAEKWTQEETEKIMEQMRENTKNNENILCLQDAIHSVDLYRSGLDYLTDKFPVFGNIKKDIQEIIIGRVNRKALSNEFNATASIFRMKQCGEKDEDNSINLSINWNESKTYDSKQKAE